MSKYTRVIELNSSQYRALLLEGARNNRNLESIILEALDKYLDE